MLRAPVTLLILHIPKTGGISLRKLVASFHSDVKFVYNGQLRLTNPDLDYIKNFREAPKPQVVMGHFGYGVHRLLGIAPAYATVLREPVARVVSYYRMEKYSSESIFRDYLDTGMSLAEFVGEQITDITNNYMCRVIAGVPAEAGMVINERWLLDLAIHNLRRHYALVGTLERYPAFITALARRLGWGAFEIPTENVASGPAIDLDSKTRDLIIEMNSLDIALFDYVKQTYRWPIAN